MLRPALVPVILVLAAAAAIAGAVGSSANTPAPGPRLRPTDFMLGAEPLRWKPGVPLGLSSPPSPRSAPGGRLSLSHVRTLPVESIFRPRTIELSRFDCALKGAGAGMRAGLFAGLLARELGAFDSGRVPWQWAGAAAAMGALFGGTIGSEDSRWNVEVRWDPEPFGGDRD
ncbi:MAG: hypothetical protein ABIK65_08900 [Candidatus Eisenbacteria bacterium]